MRKAYSRRADIPRDVLRALSEGREETRTLAEGLALDFTILLHTLAPDLHKVQIDPALGITRRMAQAAEILLQKKGPDFIKAVACHPSDTVRGWAAYMIAGAPDWSWGKRLEAMRILADDPHFAVREWAWIALRPHVVKNPEQAIADLTPWTSETSPFLRRFASEITRPRGVWCAQIPQLKKSPEQAEILLDPLAADPERYVQNSVANWLNDAGKDNPAWLQHMCSTWAVQNPGNPHTAYILKRARRSL